MDEFYHVQIEVYDDSAPNTLLEILNARYEPTVLDEIGGHGAGSFSISKSDPKILANPSLLDHRKYIKVRMNGAVIGGFIIQTKKTVIVGAGEEADEMWFISGEGPRSWSRDASVVPAKGLKRNSSDTRYFNFATEQGSWYNPSDWVTATNTLKYLQPNSRYRTAPAQWPDAPNAYFVWDRPLGGGTHPTGWAYFRHEFTVPAGDPIPHALFVAADNLLEVFVDGEQLLTGEAPAYTETKRIDFTLEPGPHVIGVKVYNIDGVGGLIASLFKYGNPAVPTAATLLSYTGQSTWKVNGYPTVEPGWTLGDILLTLLAEAEDRGIRFAENFTPTFTADLDSAGQSWGDPVPASFGVGATYEEVISALEEFGCDVWVNPDTLQINAWKKRGTDRSSATTPDSIVFLPGKNLVSADETSQAEIANTLLLHSVDGWSEEVTTTTESLTKYGRIETQMSTQLSQLGAKALVDELFRLKSLPERSATFDIIPVTGTIPFIDFNVGDMVSAPGEVPGVLESRRVMSIAFAEDERTGRPSFSVEFDSIRKSRQDELEKWLSRIANSSAIGGGFTNSSQLPPTVIQAPPGADPGAVPDAPTGLVVSSVGHYSEDGSSTSDYGLTWNPVSTADGFTSVEVDRYEVWGRPTTETESGLMAVVFDPFAYLPNFRVGDEWAFKVRAVSLAGGPGPFSAEVALVADAPAEPLLTPSAPILTSSFGGVTVKWDGLLGGAPAAPWVRYIRVERSPNGSTGWVTAGVITGTTMNDYPGSAGNEYWYRFVAVDGYGNVSSPSATASIEVQGVTSGDIAGGLASNNLVANGSFEDGFTSWEILESYATGASANVLTSGGFAGAKYLRMIRGSETSGSEVELVVGQEENVLIPISSLGSLGFFISAKASASAPVTEGFMLRAYWFLGDKTTPASVPVEDVFEAKSLTTTAEYFAGQVIPPTDARYMCVAIVSLEPSTTIYVDDVVAREAINQNMIGQNALVAEHFSAGSVTANALQAESVTAEALAAGSVLADKIGAGEIQTNHLAADVGQSLDITSNASVNILIDRTDLLREDVDTNTESVTDLMTYYSFGPDGAIIGQTDSAFKLFLKNDRIEILENGIVVSYWDSGRMVVPSFVGQEVVLVNHKFEAYGTGTVVKRISS